MTISAASSPTRLAVDIDSPVARITLRHDPVNVIDVAMMDELLQALADVETRSDISVIVIRGAGPSFSVGVDVAAHTAEKIEGMLSKFHAVVRSLLASRKVTIAAVRGNCLGGGAELAMVCDIAYSTSSARWGFPEIKLGCFPPVACASLSALVGQKRATELILTGRVISGDEAAMIGLVTRCVPDENLNAAVDEAIQQLSQLSSVALSITKKALYSWDAMHFDKGLARAEKIYLDDLVKTIDAREGIRAFMEKRSPNWEGR